MLQELNAQIIALQEVESGSEHGEFLDYLINGTDLQYIEGPALYRKNSRYGNAILTSLPVINQRLIELSYHKREPRGAIDLYLRDQQQTIRVIATHLGLSIPERRFQTDLLLQLLDTPLEKDINITLLMGDMNEWLPWSYNLRRLKRRFGHARYISSYPTFLPLLALDRIWMKPHGLMTEISRYHSITSRYASDHYPVVVKFTL